MLLQSELLKIMEKPFNSKQVNLFVYDSQDHTWNELVCYVTLVLGGVLATVSREIVTKEVWHSILTTRITTDIYIAIISIHSINPIILGVRYNDFFLFLK